MTLDAVMDGGGRVGTQGCSLGRTHALIGCGSQKRDSPACAWRLYTSTYAHKKMRVGLRVGEPDIISAEHGFVRPWTQLEPYDTHISDLSDDTLDAWVSGVEQSLRSLDASRFVLMLPQSYKRPLRAALAACVRNNITVIDLFEDTAGIGEQYAKLDDIVDGIGSEKSIESYGTVFTDAERLTEVYK